MSEKEIEVDIDLLDAFHKEHGTAYLINNAKFQNATFGRHSINKFVNDKAFKLYNQTLVSTDGVIFNLKNLLYRNRIKDVGNLFLKLYEHDGWSFVKDLKGNFAGFLYDSTTNKLILFTDHLASKPVYYSYDEKSNTLVFSSELKVVVEGMRRLGFTPHLNIKGAYCLLTLGHMLEDLTLIQEIHKLPPGNVLIFENGQVLLNEYYKLSSKPYIEDTEEEIIKELDRRFQEAVKLEYEKDLEYGYAHIATLSGGLDSRTNVAYAKKLGFDNITCFTFSQSNYLDEKIAKKICSDQHFEFLFYSLDNGDYLAKNIDGIVGSNDGLILYSGSAHLYNCLKKISFKDFGLIHTGEIGGTVVGSYLQKKIHGEADGKILNTIAYSTKLINILNDIVEVNYLDYENDEIFILYERCINGIFNGYRIIEQFTEFSSPFTDIDFLDYALKIHPKYRYKQAIYPKWINKYIKNFSNYKWEKYCLAPKYPLFVMIAYNKLRLPIRIITKRLNQKHVSMNPTEYWWKSNKILQEKINFIFKENIKLLEDYPDLLYDSSYMFEKGTLLEKTQVITLLKAIELFNRGSDVD